MEITDPPVVEQKPGNAPATIADGTVLEVKVCDLGEVTFAGPTGTLWLDRPSTFTGKVANFGARESIDLPSTPFGVHTTLAYPVERPAPPLAWPVVHSAAHCPAAPLPAASDGKRLTKDEARRDCRPRR